MSKNTNISELINYLSYDGTGNIVFTTVSAATTNTDKFLVSDAGTLKFRTAAQLLSDIGAQASGSYQAALSGTGFVKISGSTISYDNSTYLTTSSASSTYLPLSGGTLTGTLNGTSSNFSSNTTIGGNDSIATRLYVRTEDTANTPSLTLFKNISSSSTEDVFRVQSWNGSFNTIASIKANGSAAFSGTGYFGGATTTSGLTGASELIVQNEIGIQNTDTTGPYLRMVMGGLNQNITFVTGAFSGTEPNLLFSVGGSTRLTLNASTGAATFSNTVRTGGISIGVAATANVLDVRGENNTFDGTIVIGARGTLQHRDAGQTIISLANDYNDNAAKMEFRMKGNTSANSVLTLLGSGAATFSSSVTATSGTFSGTGIGTFNSQIIANNTTSGAALITFQNTANGHAFGFSSVGTGGQRFSFFNGAPAEIAYITSSGAANFSSSITSGSSISAGGNISGLDITGSMFLTATSSVSSVGTSFVNSGTSFGNTTGIWLVSITAFGDGNMYSAALYVVTTAAYSKTLNLIGGPSNHFGNGSVVAELSTTDGVSADLRVRRTTVGSATVYVKVIRTGS
jgi:hypothetical protein